MNLTLQFGRIRLPRTEVDSTQQTDINADLLPNHYYTPRPGPTSAFPTPSPPTWMGGILPRLDPRPRTAPFLPPESVILRPSAPTPSGTTSHPPECREISHDR
jgi:hypothetical protein